MSHKCEDCEHRLLAGASSRDWKCRHSKVSDVEPVTQETSYRYQTCRAFRKYYRIIAAMFCECGRTGRYFKPKTKEGDDHGNHHKDT